MAERTRTALIGFFGFTIVAACIAGSSKARASSASAKPFLRPALSLDQLKPLNYDCRVAMLLADGTFFEKNFVALADSGSHGGQDQSFDAGNGYKIDVIADERWLGIIWTKGADTIAKGVYVWNEGDVVHRAAIFYNPKNDAEQAQLSCSKQIPPKPSR